MPECLIGLGANLGDREQTLTAAVAGLVAHPQVEMVAQSGWYQTEPVGGPSGQSEFLNGALRVLTRLSPDELLDHIRRIEKELGRDRHERWEARTVDLDLLLYGDTVSSSVDLDVPHPRMAWRRFVLEPAAEIAGDMLHPVLSWSIARLLEHLNSSTPYVAITGPPGVGKTLLVRDLVDRLSGRIIERPLAAAEADDPSSDWWSRSDSPDLAWRRENDLLNARARQLKSADWPMTEQIVISDFWFDQSLAYAAVNLPDERLPAFQDHWQALRSQVVQPRLTVFLAASAEPAHDPPSKDMSASAFQRLSVAFTELAKQPGLGPILTLSNEDPQRWLEEVLAAVQSMR